MIAKSKYDKLSLGIAAGLIVPAIMLLLIFWIRKGEYSLGEYFRVTYLMKLLPKLISLCLLPNLILFFVFLKLNRLLSARGVLVSMFIAGFFIVLFKFI